jgi:hypothetical protein
MSSIERLWYVYVPIPTLSFGAAVLATPDEATMDAIVPVKVLRVIIAIS